jgi:hypothetical protein
MIHVSVGCLLSRYGALNPYHPAEDPLEAAELASSSIGVVVVEEARAGVPFAEVM